MLRGLPGQQGTSSAVTVKPPDVTSSWTPALGRTPSWGSWLWTEGEALELGSLAPCPARSPHHVFDRVPQGGEEAPGQDRQREDGDPE